MRIRLHVERTIRATPDAVFALALDPARFPATFSGFGPIPAIRSITLTGPLAVGGTRELENSDGTRLTERITALEAPRRHAYTLSGIRPPLSWLALRGDADWAFMDAPGGTHVSWSYVIALTSPLAWPVAWPVLRGFMHGAMRRCLDAMARSLERPA
jgi:Polyketide cyclase / dehydrase and lipid transport